jgi:hypothetical protein
MTFQRQPKRKPVGKHLALTEAWKRLRNGKGTREDFELVLTDLLDHTGYYRRPSYAEWMLKTKTPDGFELHSALSNARAEVLERIMSFLLMDDEELISLERAARAEAQQG